MDLVTDTITINTPGQIKRFLSKINFVAESQQCAADQSEHLIDIAYKSNEYYIKKLSAFNSFEEELQSNYLPWIMFKGVDFPKKNRRYKLSQGDIVKIGKEKLHVKQMHICSDKKKEETIEAKKPIKNTKSKKKFKVKQRSSSLILLPELNNSMSNMRDKSSQEKRICKICYSFEIDSSVDPLIRPCVCSGSVKYIHYKCLKQWLTMKIIITHISTIYCIVYSVKLSKCELCKTAFPEYINHKDKLYDLLDLDPGWSNYIILQNAKNDIGKSRYLYYLNYDLLNVFSLGRGKDVDVILGEISISRFHCQILRDGDAFYVQDCNSKFGTGILVQTPLLRIIQDKPLNLQISHSYLQIAIKIPFTFLSCCKEPIADNNIDYQRLNSLHVHQKLFEVIQNEPIDTSIDDNKAIEHNNNYLDIECMTDRKADKSIIHQSHPVKSSLIMMNKMNKRAINISNLSQKVSSTDLDSILKKKTLKDKKNHSRNIKKEKLKIISSSAKFDKEKEIDDISLINSICFPSVININQNKDAVNINKENNSFRKIKQEKQNDIAIIQRSWQLKKE